MAGIDWKNLQIWQFAMLSDGQDPRDEELDPFYDGKKMPDSASDEACRRADSLISYLGNGLVVTNAAYPFHNSAELPTFVALAKSLGWKLPDALEQMAVRRAEEERAQAEAERSAQARAEAEAARAERECEPAQADEREAACEDWLKDQRRGPAQTSDECWAEAQKRYPGLAHRAFKRAWDRAREAFPNPEWDKPGPKPKPRIKTNWLRAIDQKS